MSLEDRADVPGPIPGGDDVRATLPELIATVRSSRWKPWGLVRALAIGAQDGAARARQLPELRRSYFRSLAVVASVLCAQLSALVALAPLSMTLTCVLVSVVWFVFGSCLLYSQISLVRKKDGTFFSSFGVANTLTLYRFLCVPFLVTLMPIFPEDRQVLQLGVVVYAAVAMSDILDGNYARMTGTVSEFGRIYDPLCDIATNALVCAGAWGAGYVPTWYFALAEVRFFLPLLGGIWVYAYSKPWRIRPTFWGKITVFVYDLFVGLTLLREVTQAPFMDELTQRFLWVSGILFAFNVLVIIDRGVSLVCSRQAR